MGKLPRSESNVLLALSSKNSPAHGSVPFICAHNNHRAGQQERCWGCCPEAGRAIMQETCVPGKAGWTGTCLCRCCPRSIRPQTFVKHLFFGKCWGIFALKMFGHYHACVTVRGNRNTAGKLIVAIIPLPKQGQAAEWLAIFQLLTSRWVVDDVPPNSYLNIIYLSFPEAVSQRVLMFF